MDTLAALALATEQPSMALLDRPPRPREASLISPRMWTNIIGHAIYQLSVMLFTLYFGHRFLGVPRDSLVHRTVVFNSFILMQVWNEFNARKLHEEINVFEGVFRSKGHLAVTAVMVLFQVFAVQIAGHFFGTVPLSLQQWVGCSAIGMFAIPWGIFLRKIPVSEVQLPTGPAVLVDKEFHRFRGVGQDMVHRIRVAKALKHSPRPIPRSRHGSTVSPALSPSANLVRVSSLKKNK
jgi:magnesium-transporting ATPase (P-type)